MRTLVLPLVLLAACDTGSFSVAGLDGTDDTVAGDTDLGGADTDVAGDTDLAADTDVVTDTDAGGGGGGGGGLDPFTRRPLQWVGQRDFDYLGWDGDHCLVHVDEAGPELLGADTTNLKSACPACTRFFNIALTATGDCTGQGFAPETFRGLEFLPGGKVDIHVIYDSGRGWDEYSLGAGIVAVPSLAYTYADQSWYYRSIGITGAVTLTPQ